MKKAIAAIVTSVALGFAGQAQACTGQHLATVGTSSNDAACIFNVDVHADWYAAGIDSGQTFADMIAQQLDGQAAGASVNMSWDSGEGNVQFSVPAGMTEVTITVEDSSDTSSHAGTNYFAAGGSSGSTTEVLVNGKFESQAAAGGASGACVPPPPPLPPVNTAVPGPGLDPDDNKAAMNDLQKGNVPLSDHDGDDMGHRTGKVE